MNGDMKKSELLDFVLELLAYAGKHAPSKYLISGFRPLVVKVDRSKNAHTVGTNGTVKRHDGTVTVKLPDEAVVDLGKHGGEDAWFLVRVKREVLDTMKERKESVLILPEHLQ